LAASVNASLAEFNRSFFTSANVNATDLAAIDSLENAIESSFSSSDPDVLTRSQSFGKAMLTPFLPGPRQTGMLR